MLVGVLVAVLVAIGVVVWQLAGDDPPSQQDYAERANEICREAEQTLEDVTEGAQSPEELAQAVGRVIEESRNAVDELEDLERPEGEAGERAQEFVEASRTEIEGKGIPVLEDLRDALEDGDQQAAQEAAQRLRQIDSSQSNRTARAVGADACGDGEG